MKNAALKSIVFIFSFTVSLLCSLTGFAGNFADSLRNNSDHPNAAMSGIYTVNPAAAVSATNFVRIGQADTAMMNNGIDGPVIIQIYNGTYSIGNNNLGTVPGSSPANTITFTSFSNDSLQVIISNLNFENASNIIVKKLNLNLLTVNGTGSNYTVSNNQVFNFSYTAGNDLNFNTNYIKVQGFVNIASKSGAYLDGIKVENNTFKGMTYVNNAGIGTTGNSYMVNWSRVRKPVLRSNTFNSVNMINIGYSLIGCCTYVPYAYGSTFQFDNCTDTAFVEGNKFETISTDRLVHDINLAAQNVPSSRLSIIVIRNNFFTVSGTLGMNSYAAGACGNQFYYNNVNNVGNGTGPYLSSNTSVMVNNIFASTNGKRAFTFATHPGNADYNDYYTAGTDLVVYTGTPAATYNTFTQYRSATGTNANGKNVNPKYYDSLNLHVKHPGLLAAGTPYPVPDNLLKDIDNDNRNQLNPCIGADEFQAPSADVVAIQYTSPKKDFTAATPLPLKIKFLNNGSAPLNQVNIRWSINGTEQAPYAWSGNLAYDSTAEVIFGNYSFEMVKYTALKVWLDQPNGTNDMVPVNDTLKIDSIMPYAKGEFTLGGTTPHFASFVKAGELLTYGGVEAPVTVNVRNGKYTEQAILKYVRGTNNTNIITYKGENNNANLDTLSFSSTGTGTYKYPTMRLDSAAFMTFKNITIQSLSTYSREVEFSNRTRFITFDSCVFTAAFTNPTYAHIDSDVPVFGIPPIDSNVVFTNNSFKAGGNNGILLPVKNAVIKGNRFEGLNGGSGYAISLSGTFTGTNTMLIDSNYINNGIVCTYAIGNTCYITGYNPIGGIAVTTAGTVNNISITRNTINAISRNGINITASGTAGSPIKVYNNFVTIRNSGTAYNATGAYIEAIHNSFADSANSTSNLVNITGLNNTFKNNVLVKGIPGVVSTSTANLLSLGSSAIATFVSTNNAYAINDSTKSIYNGSTNMTLGQWKATGKDANSLTTVPAFVNTGNNLHINKNKAGAVDLAKKATPIAYITMDIDDSTRSLTAPCIGADEFTLNDVDGGALAVTAPGYPTAPGVNTVKASFKNYGEQNIASASLAWSVNGVLQAPYSWSGSLASGDSITNLTLGTYNFANAMRYDIKVWTENVNGGADVNTVNDTTSRSVYPALCGTYTIAGITPDFTTLKDALNYARSAGVTCAVLFNIRDGVYNEADTISGISGLSATNTLTIQGESLDSSKVLFTQEDYIPGGQIVFRVDNAPYVTIKNITIKRTSPGIYHFYFDVIALANDVTGFTIRNCDVSSAAGTLISFPVNYQQPAQSLSIVNNNFTGGQYGVYVNANYLMPQKSMTVSGNNFRRPVAAYSSSFAQLYLNYTGSNLIIDNNFFDSTYSAGLMQAVSLSNAAGKTSITNNKILKRKGSHGMYLSSVAGANFADSAVLIANNFITADSVGNVAALYGESIGRNVKVLYNNLLQNGYGNSTTSSALYFSHSFGTGTFRDTIANNNIITTGVGYALYQRQISSGDVNCTNNNIWTPAGTKLAYYNNTQYNTIATLATASATHTASVSMNPSYINNSNLHVNELALRTLGKPFSYVPNDIDGDVRGTVTSTIGADEIVISNNDAGVAALVTPVVPFAAGNQNITVSIKNFGTAALTTATVNWSINATLQTPYSFSGNVPFNTTANAIIGTVNFVVDSAYSIKAWTTAPNGGADANALNDTLLVTNIYPALSGTYTIGGVSPDFKSFTRSSNNLKYGGMLGNVVFNARNGRYNEALAVDSIPYQNNYSVVWQSESGDSSAVVLHHAPALNDNILAAVQLNNTKNISIKKMTVQVKIPASNSSASYISIVYLSKKNKNAQLVSNQLIDSTYFPSPSPNTTGSRFIYNTDASQSSSNTFVKSADSALVIDRNYFKQANLSVADVINISGSYTTDFQNNITVTNYLNNVSISNNKFDLKLYNKAGISIAQADSLKVTGNKIQGLVAVQGKDLMIVDKNEVYHEGYNQNVVTISSSVNRAIGKPVIVSNNLIQSVRSGFFNGVAVPNNALYVTGDRVNIIHNSIATSDTGNVSGWSNGAALALLSSKLDTVKNNIFYNMNGGNLVSQQTVTTLTSNNNDYVYSNHFSPSAANLAAYRTLTGQDAQSVENIQPYFRGPRDLHASNIQLKAAPLVTPSNLLYLTDVDGQLRGALSCYGADEFLQPANDMVVLEAAPKKVFPEGSNDVKIRVYNNGTNPITSFTATSKITNYPDGYTPVVAGTLSYNYTGLIAPGAEAWVTLGQSTVPFFRNQFKVNTYNLNGTGDEVPYTDSLQNDAFYAGLNGNYTFKDYGNNNAATFKAFSEVADQLKYGGVYGPSALNLLPGLYTASLYIDSIPNRGALSPLVIQSQNGDSSTTGFLGNGNSNLTLYRANNVTVKNLYFGPGSGGTSATYQIALGFSSQNISFENNKIVNNTAALTAANANGTNAIFMSGNWAGQYMYNDSNYTFKNNLIIGGNKGIVAGGVSSGLEKNMVITNNTFVNQYSSAIESSLIRNLSVDSNSVETNTANDQYKAVYFVSAIGATKVVKNKINISKDGFGVFNEDVQYGPLTVNDTLRIVNNFITVGESKASIGIKINTVNVGKQLQVLYNSINNRSTLATSAAFNILTGQFGGKSEVMNNIFFNKYTGVPVIVYKYAPSAYIHHNNNLYTNGTVYGTVNNVNYATLAALSSSTTVDYSSVAGDPLFVSDTDLHVDGALVNNTGSYDANVYTQTDIDNEARSSSAPDIGADEFKLPNFGAVQLETPLSSCSHSSTETVKAWIKNFGTAPRTNVPVAYRINLGTIIKDTVRTSINPGDSVLFSFAQTANLAVPMDYYFDVWTAYRGDSLPANDTLKQFLVATTPSNPLPYYTGFEGTSAGWYTGGQNSSFRRGVVFSGIIDSSANGLNAWKSNLTGPHNNNEYSYIYSPCFDMSGVTADPTLNFNLAFQLENNNDKAWLEWSGDGGSTWTKLGAQGEGLAWYNNGGGYWTGLNKMWHNAKHTIPVTALGDKSRVRVRFVFQSNSSNVQDGIAIDDVSIYTGDNPPVSAGTYAGRTAVSTGTAAFVPVNDPSGNRLVEINDNGQSLGTITVDVNQNNGGVPTSYNGSTYLGRSWVIKVQNAPTGPVRVRLFFTQAEVDAWRALDPTVDLMRNIAVYKFSGNIEDFSLANNSTGTPLTLMPAMLVKVPYLDGYFMEFSVSSFSEFWLTKAPGLGVVPVNFETVKATLQKDDALVTWKVSSEINVSHYNVLHSTDGTNFSSTGRVDYHTGGSYSFLHKNIAAGRNYYRIQQVDLDGHSKLSSIVSVVRKDGVKLNVYPTIFTSVFKVDNTANKPGLIALFTADGKQVLQSKLAAGVNVVDGSMLAKGVYFYRIVIDGVVADNGKLVKE